MGEFIAEFLLDLIVAPVLNLVAAGLVWLLRTGLLLLLYPIILFSGWLRLWVQERGKIGFFYLWGQHSPAGLHQFGWQQAVLDVESFFAALLILLGCLGIGLVLYWGGKAAGL